MDDRPAESEQSGAISLGGVAGQLLEVARHELMLFAAVGLLIGGIDDLLVDLLYIVRGAWRCLSGRRDPLLAELPAASGRTAMLIAAWDESAVIGPMLRTTLARLTEPGLTIYVGLYPNDWATTEIVAAIAAVDARVRPVVGLHAGPTTKAANLNQVWRALVADEAAAGVRFDAIVLHDAEDVISAGELRVIEHGLRTHEGVQLPVLPLVHPQSRWIGGVYIDEFAEAHTGRLVVRQMVAASLPFAGVGCAVRRDVLGTIAAARGGSPFDSQSLTEDYELGLSIADAGGRVMIAQVRERAGGPPVAVREFFPDTIQASVRQKARWMIGIALAGWDRTGWAGWRNIGDHWMRAQDRKALIAVAVLLAAYLTPLLWLLSELLHVAGVHRVRPLDPVMAELLLVNAALLGWRLLVRAFFVGRRYGAGEALRSMPRLLIGNFIALLAARRAVTQYWQMLRGRPLHWDKTAHRFPDDATIAA
ncbi:adsorption protein B [Sphingomonas guangdongensis]|uniref:Adsorption protein B n=1 Tax=Sphingomonas guangdongensis TaxID=1141890 RepID=A0A285QFS7_9SPHN|nr:glycosyl transferase family protein [Sphingomonas guangdongensis]SOB78922.1 adsorption protein B [Sphingomonas guangdongensis]